MDTLPLPDDLINIIIMMAHPRINKKLKRIIHSINVVRLLDYYKVKSLERHIREANKYIEYLETTRGMGVIGRMVRNGIEIYDNVFFRKQDAITIYGV